MKNNPLNDLDQLILKQAEEERKEHQPKLRHSVSSYCQYHDGATIGKCLRAQFFDWMNIPPTNTPPKNVYVQRIGNLIHDDLYKLWSEAGYDILTEHELEFVHHPEELHYPIKGRPDAIISKDGEKLHISVKTTHGGAFWRKGDIMSGNNLLKPSAVYQISH